MFRSRMFAALLALAIAAPATAAAEAPEMPQGLWLNPHNSVVVRTGPCGQKLCGWIVWANDQAKADAKDGGVAELVGTELLQGYAAKGTGAWSGTVFVPDMNRRFSSEINQLSPTQLKVKGCILGGLICKSQVWTRIDRVPHA